MRVGVVGSRGSVGSAVVSRLADLGEDVVDLGRFGADESESDLATRVEDVEVIVNCAGHADPGMKVANNWVNVELPVRLMKACSVAGVRRFVHVSSGAVQGYTPALNERAEYSPFSAYSASKADAERQLLGVSSRTELVLYRLTSVLTATKLHRARALGVVSLGLMVPPTRTLPLPMTTLASASDSIATLCAASLSGEIVLQPWEGVTTGSFWDLANTRFSARGRSITTKFGARMLVAARPDVARLVTLLTEGQAVVSPTGSAAGLGHATASIMAEAERMLQ